MLLNLILPALMQSVTPTPSDDTAIVPQTESEETLVDGADEADEAEEEGEIVVPGEVKKKPKLICKREAAIGSGIRRKICRTKEQIDAEAEAGRATAREMASQQQIRRAQELQPGGPN